MSLVPMIDLAPFVSADPAARHRVARTVDDALRHLGFMQVRGHGVPDDVVAAMVAATDAFFALPLETKLRCRPERLDVNRGYAAMGAESLAYSLGVAAPADLFEAFNIGPDDVDERDPFVAAERHRIFAPNVWPAEVPELRPALTAYFAEARRVAHLLTDVFAVALGLEEHWFAPATDRSTDTMRAIHYERRPGDPEPVEGQMRMGAHSDYGICTVLWADPVPGLQIVGPDGAWHDVVPEPGALLVNLGDLTAEWTNDRWRSTLHRVVPPPSDATGGARRRSVAFFHDGNYDAVVECLPTCCSADNPAKYPRTTAGEHLMNKLMGPRTLQASDAVDTAGERIRAVTEG